MTKDRKIKWGWFDDMLYNIFGIIGIFGWFAAIWIKAFRWEIFFTCLVSFILLLILHQLKKEFKEDEEKINLGDSYY